jgi:hypothetical protein
LANKLLDKQTRPQRGIQTFGGTIGDGEPAALGVSGQGVLAFLQAMPLTRQAKGTITKTDTGQRHDSP